MPIRRRAHSRNPGRSREWAPASPHNRQQTLSLATPKSRLASIGYGQQDGATKSGNSLEFGVDYLLRTSNPLSLSLVVSTVPIVQMLNHVQVFVPSFGRPCQVQLTLGCILSPKPSKHISPDIITYLSVALCLRPLPAIVMAQVPVGPRPSPPARDFAMYTRQRKFQPPQHGWRSLFPGILSCSSGKFLENLGVEI